LKDWIIKWIIKLDAIKFSTTEELIKIMSLENRRKNIIKIFSILRELLLKKKDRQKRDIHNRRPFPYEMPTLETEGNIINVGTNIWQSESIRARTTSRESRWYETKRSRQLPKGKWRMVDLARFPVLSWSIVELLRGLSA